MANTGFKITPNAKQFFTSGPTSGSEVSGSFIQPLSIPPFSSSLNNEDFFNRSFDPINFPIGYEDCLEPLLTSISTGSQRGRFEINYITQSSFNSPIAISASISNNNNFSNTEIFSASIDSVIPITTSIVSGAVFFNAFCTCSGPSPSSDSQPLHYIYDILPPPLPAGTVNLIFKNTLADPMVVEIRSLRGNRNYKIASKQSVTYDYSTSPDPGAWYDEGRSEDLVITIKGGANSTYGNSIQRSTDGIEKETHTTGGGFRNPASSTDNSSTFDPDKGLTFNVKQLVLPKNNSTTTTTFTLIQNTPPPPPPPSTPPPAPSPGPGPRPSPHPYIDTQYGSIPYETVDQVCGTSGVDFREKNYFIRRGYLYESRDKALDDTKPNYTFTKNYILIDPTTYLIVNKNGYIQNKGVCELPFYTIFTNRGNFSTQEEACKRKKTLSGSTTFTYKDNKLVGSNLSGRYPLYSGTSERGGTNIILSSGNIIGFETCGSELTNVQLSFIGYNNSLYPLETPELINPRTLNWICSTSQRFENYSLGPSGVVYYGFNYKNGQYKYVPLGLGIRWYRTSDGKFVIYNRGLVTNTIENITFCN